MARERPRHGPVVERTSSCTPPVVPPKLGNCRTPFALERVRSNMAPTKPPAPRHTVNRRLVIVSRVRPLCYLSLSGCRHTRKESIGIWLGLDSKRAEQKLARKRQTLAKESIYLPRARTNVVCASLYPRQRGAYKSPGKIGRGLRKESTAGCLHMG